MEKGDVMEQEIILRQRAVRRLWPDMLRARLGDGRPIQHVVAEVVVASDSADVYFVPTELRHENGMRTGLKSEVQRKYMCKIVREEDEICDEDPTGESEEDSQS